jgi:glutaminase
MDYSEILEEIYDEVQPLLKKGKVASYIPELKRVNKEQFGMAVCTNEGDEYIIGCADKYLSIQSVSKVFTFAMAYKEFGQRIWKRVGKEPSGTKFNSLILLENENGIPRNPFINPGAIVIADMLYRKYRYPMNEVLKFVRELSGNPNITFNTATRNSELKYANLNYSLAYFMKAHKNIKSDVHKLIDFYTSHCAIEMTCVDLARSFRLFCQDGKNPWNGRKILTESQSKHINAVMMTCGLYNSVGDFAYRVGMPAKSGVGGAVVGVIPDKFSVAVWAPGLDKNGNSIAGVKALELFTDKTGFSIY